MGLILGLASLGFINCIEEVIRVTCKSRKLNSFEIRVQNCGSIKMNLKITEMQIIIKERCNLIFHIYFVFNIIIIYNIIFIYFIAEILGASYDRNRIFSRINTIFY